MTGGTHYWKDMGLSSAFGGPDGNGFYDKDAARAYALDKWGPSAFTNGFSGGSAMDVMGGGNSSAMNQILGVPNEGTNVPNSGTQNADYGALRDALMQRNDFRNQWRVRQ